jgi:ATP-dependent DNA ligase
VAEYIIQKAVAPDKVKKALQRTLAEYGQFYIAQPKWDGCCAVLFTDEVRGLSRTGEVYPSLIPAATELREQMGPGYVLIGEAWWPGKDQFNLISGEFRRQEPSVNLTVIVNDCLTAAEFAAGHSAVPYEERFARIPVSQGNRWGKAGHSRPGTYGCPQALCNRYADEGGYDGLILRDPNGTWTAGRGTTGEIIKIKRVLSYDLRVLEVNTAIGGKTGRTVYKIVVDFDGKRLGVGSGIPHTEADVPKVGQIVEIEAMDYSSEGLLREPRFKGVRYDKLSPDTL